MKELVVGLDIGTTNCKALAFDLNGKPISSATHEYSIKIPSPGRCILDFNDVWNAVCKVLYMIGNDVGSQCIGLSISAIGEAFIPINEQGEPVINEIILAFDNRASKECNELISNMGYEEIFYSTGLIPHPMHTISKIMWFKHEYQELYTKTMKFHCLGDYILKKLGAAPLIDHSMASRTMAYNINYKKWDDNILEAAEIPQGMLPEIASSSHYAGKLSKELSREFCLPFDLPLFVGGMDQNCAALGCGLIKEGLVMDSVGTAEAILTAVSNVSDPSLILKNGLIFYPHVIPNMLLVRGTIPSAGSILRWCRDNLFQDIVQWAKDVSPYEIMFNGIDEEPSRICVLPYFSGRGSSGLNPNARGAILGLDLSIDRFEILKSIVEALVLEFSLNIRTLRHIGFGIKEVRAVGGGAQSNKWLQFKADASKCAISRCEVSEAASLGAAILACLGLKVYKTVEDAVGAMVHIKGVTKPNPNEEERWNQQENKVRDMINLLCNSWYS